MKMNPYNKGMTVRGIFGHAECDNERHDEKITGTMDELWPR
jgi:hypothetical protein